MGQPVSRPRTWLFAARSASPYRATRGSVDQGRLPRGSSVSLRWVRSPGNDSPLFAPAVDPGKTRDSEPNPGPSVGAPAAIGQSRNRANYLWGPGPSLDMSTRDSLHVAQRRTAHLPPQTATWFFLSPRISRDLPGLFGHPGHPSQLLSETHYSRSALEYGDTAMSASARVTAMSK